MGNLFTSIQEFLSSKKPQRLLMLGLDGAGKTTILYKLRLGETVHTIPTIGFNVEDVMYKNINFTVWDIGGQDRIRPLWKHYFAGTTGLLFVVDSNDRERVQESSEELWRLLGEEHLKNVPIAVIANKQDLPNSCTTEELIELLRLNDCKTHKFQIFATVGTSGQGLYSAFEWLSNASLQK